MSFDPALLFAFLLVFVRCSAMLFASPMFGAQNTPVTVRTMTTLAIAGALTLALKPKIGPMPQDLYALAAAVLTEAVAGIVIGLAMSLVLQAAQIAGAILDMQLGLGMSQALNPLQGVPITILSQFKFLLATAVYLSMDGHHVMLTAFAQSYTTVPTLTLQTLPAIQETLVGLCTTVFVLAVQIAAPALAVTMVVDAALALTNKAVPQMQALMVGIPAKTLVGMIAVSLALPALAGSVSSGVEHATFAAARLFGM